MPPHSPLPEAARAAAWSALWRRLLQPIPDDTAQATEPESDDDEEDEESAA